MTSALQEFNLTVDHFLDRTTVLYGESGCGKSTIIVDMLHKLKPHVDQIVVVSPTDKVSGTYGPSKIVPLPFVHYTVNTEMITELWTRQEALAEEFNAYGNNMEVLERLASYLPQAKTISDQFAALYQNMDRAIDDLRLNKKGHSEPAVNLEIDLMKAKVDRVVKSSYRKIILDHRRHLERDPRLDDEDRRALSSIDLNPRMVLIFDDCTDQLARLKKSDVIERMFYQGRHAKLTIIMAAHTDTAFAPAIKKNTFMSIFCSSKTSTAYFSRPSAGITKEEQVKVKQALREVFVPSKKHQKMIWLRDNGEFYKYTAERHAPFEFCEGGVMAEFCAKITPEKGAVNMNNKYARFLNQ